MAGRYDDNRCGATWGRKESNLRPSDYERFGSCRSGATWSQERIPETAFQGSPAPVSDGEGREMPDAQPLICAWCGQVAGHTMGQCPEFLIWQLEDGMERGY